MRAFIAALFAITLVGCAGATPWTNPAQYAGINYATFEYPTEQGAITGTLYGGKEQGSVGITIRHPSGVEVEYTATDVKAFEGQKVRAAVEEAVSADAKEAMPGIVDTITDAIIRATSP